MVNTEDKKLVEDFLNGNDFAFQKIADKYSKKIYWHARGMVNNHFDADEVTQEVLLVLYKKLNNFKFESSLYTWIYKITSTRSLNYIRKSKLKKLFSISGEEFKDLKTDVNLFDDFERKEKIKQVDEVLKKIPAKQREVFIMKNFEGLSYKEISEITGKSVGGLKANYFHALKKIMEYFDEKE